MHLVNKNAPQVQLKDYKVEFVLYGSDEVVGNTLLKLSDYLDADKRGMQGLPLRMCSFGERTTIRLEI